MWDIQHGNSSRTTTAKIMPAVVKHANFQQQALPAALLLSLFSRKSTLKMYQRSAAVVRRILKPSKLENSQSLF